MTASAAAPAAAEPSLVRFGALSLCYFAAIGLFNPYAPLWFQSLGFSTLLIGGIASLQSWTRVVAPYAWSWFGDHGGRRVELIRLSAAGALLSALGLMGVQAAVPVAAVVAMMFIANSGVVPLSEATLAHLLNTGKASIPGVMAACGCGARSASSLRSPSSARCWNVGGSASFPPLSR